MYEYEFLWNMQTPATGWGKVSMYQAVSVTANERTASLSSDQSEAEKLAHDHSDEYLTVTSQGGNREHLYQETIFNIYKFFVTM